MSTAVISGGVLLVVTVLVHALGTNAWVRLLMWRYADRQGQFKGLVALGAVIGTALILLALHIVEVVLWAFAYLLLLPPGQLQTLEEAAYFSLATFTTVGYGDVALTAADWRPLSGMEALDGMLLLGWSTAMLYGVVHRSWTAYEEDGP